jgi:hypothetical protein
MRFAVQDEEFLAPAETRRTRRVMKDKKGTVWGEMDRKYPQIDTDFHRFLTRADAGKKV